MTIKQIYRQGDVLVLRVTEVASEEVGPEVPREGGRIVLAHGEATGHTHAIDAPPPVAVLFQSKKSVDRILKVRPAKPNETIRLYHDEHAPIELPAGDYVIRRQREYRWGEARVIAD